MLRRTPGWEYWELFRTAQRERWRTPETVVHQRLVGPTDDRDNRIEEGRLLSAGAIDSQWRSRRAPRPAGTPAHPRQQNECMQGPTTPYDTFAVRPATNASAPFRVPPVVLARLPTLDRRLAV